LVTKVYYNNKLKVQFSYNDKGFRVQKKAYAADGTSVEKTTHYVRDASGSTMAIYENKQQVELPIYGASRLGIYKKPSNTSVYQLTDHLGNVRAVIAKSENEIIQHTKTVFSDNLENSAGWDSQGAKYGTSAVLNTERAKSGTHSVKIVNPNYNQYRYAHSNTWIPIDNPAASEYKFSGWFYSTGPRVRFVLHMKENEETNYFTLTANSAVSSERNKWVYIEKTASVPANIDIINFRVDTFGGGYDSAGTVWYDDLKIEKDTSVYAAALTHATDYYPFGMPMPGRQIVGGEPYRYAFQGQEKDPETGKEAFQLRLWDSRIGRWLTTDPAGQYHSPYLGMGNNPMNGVDPDGAFWEELGNWFSGNGWNTNGALDFQANGGTLGDWVGDKFTGYRKGFGDGSNNEVTIAVFRSKDDLGAPKNYALDNIVSPPMEFSAWFGHSIVLGFYGAGYMLNEGLHGRETEGLKVESPYTVKIPKFVNGNFALEDKNRPLTNKEIENEILIPGINTIVSRLPTKFVKNEKINALMNYLRDIFIGEMVNETHNKIH